MLDLFRLDNKVALVTGGGRGLGKAMALAYAQAGADVAVVSRTREEVEDSARNIRDLNRKALSCVGDVSNKNDVEVILDQVLQKFGKVDILINNAGIFEGSNAREVPLQAFEKHFDVHLKGSLLFCQGVVDSMKKQGYGKIINVSSILGFEPAKEALAYCVSKAGLIQMTRVLALEWGSLGIRVNAIAPGLFETQMTKTFTQDKKLLEEYCAQIPLGRCGRPEDIRGLAVFLASQASDHITGQTIIIDGGASLIER